MSLLPTSSIDQNGPIGLGIRPELFDDVLEKPQQIDFFEAHSENYFLDTHVRKRLLRLRQDYPISLHSVSLSLGRADDLDTRHILQLKQLIDEIEPCLISEHLAWSAFQHHYVPDLFPLPLHAQSFDVVCQHISQYQDAIKRQILIENPSNYLLFAESDIEETAFLNAVAAKTGCGLLIDVNNVYVSAKNCNFCAKEYMASLNSECIGQYHLAGHTEVDKEGEALLIDTHNQLVSDSVWDLFAYTLALHGKRPSLIEWDSDFPDFVVLQQQCDRAKQCMAQAEAPKAKTTAPVYKQQNSACENIDLFQFQADFMHAVRSHANVIESAVMAHRPRIAVYQNNVFQAIYEYLCGVFPAAQGVVGQDYFKQMARQYFALSPPSKGDIHLYGEGFSGIVEAFSELGELVYLEQLIEMEWCIYRTQFSEMDAEQLLEPHQYTEQELFALELACNPSVTLRTSEYPLYQIWRQSLPDYQEPVSIDLNATAEAVLICKVDEKIQVLCLERKQMNFVILLKNTKNLFKAIEKSSQTLQPEEMSDIISLLFEYQILLVSNTLDDKQPA